MHVIGQIPGLRKVCAALLTPVQRLGPCHRQAFRDASNSGSESDESSEAESLEEESLGTDARAAEARVAEARMEEARVTRRAEEGSSAGGFGSDMASARVKWRAGVGSSRDGSG
eukprot:CAMPEP_0174893990 /NCGR_PEP_ID=MMETSP0167-20121228/8700_1 /TAXON_ID=38298 /ORGANISM="Rhodella maculata, Strain CCMP736" /LENGTH=113 /DNA_ID=CAMNT_0016132945 /DNA_START=1629 /DNA_END=1968 /DNA_ORIENTATION=-